MYRKIVDWYEENKRDLEFRKYNDPYSIWISEIMAQQTKIDTMIPYFKRWMFELPTIDDCANASIEKVLKLWEGLGYYRRAKLLHQGCIYVKEQHNSVFPSELENIKKIPGIGDYTAAAISSIVFNKPTPAIDGNVIRVVSRIFTIEEDTTKSSTKKHIYNIVKSWMENNDDYNYSSFTQGLMEIGALICTPRNPNCAHCPLNESCYAYKTNNQEHFPLKKMKKKIPFVEYAVLIAIVNNKILVSNDWSDGLMKGLIRLPQVDLDELENYQDYEVVGSYSHIFTHKKWKLNICVFNKEFIDLKNSWYWLEIDKINEVALITAHKRILEKYTDHFKASSI